MDAVQERTGLARLREPFLEKLRIISAVRRKSINDILEEFAGPRVDAEHAAVIREQRVKPRKKNPVG